MSLPRCKCWWKFLGKDNFLQPNVQTTSIQLHAESAMGLGSISDGGFSPLISKMHTKWGIICQRTSCLIPIWLPLDCLCSMLGATPYTIHSLWLFHVVRRRLYHWSVLKIWWTSTHEFRDADMKVWHVYSEQLWNETVRRHEDKHPIMPKILHRWYLDMILIPWTVPRGSRILSCKHSCIRVALKTAHMDLRWNWACFAWIPVIVLW